MIDILVTRPYGVGNAVQAIPALRMLKEGLEGLDDYRGLKYALWLEDRPSIELLESDFPVVSRLLEPGRRMECNVWISLFPADSGMEPDHYERRLGYSAKDLADVKAAYNWNEVAANAEIVANYLGLDRGEYMVPSCELWPQGGGRFDAKEDMIGIHPGCQAGDGGIWKRKRWPVEHWKLLIKTLIMRGKTIMIFGTSYADSDMVIPLLRSFDGVPAQVKWQLDRKTWEAAGTAGRCEAFVSNDSGMAHIALAGGCQKVLILYGPTRPEKNTHDGAVAIVTKACPHQPCYSDVFSPEGKACKVNKCMQVIPVKRVLEALE